MEDIYTVYQISETLSNTSVRQQSSAGSGSTKFATLMQQKRNPTDDAATQRRLSHSDMQPKAGFFGNMWNR